MSLEPVPGTIYEFEYIGGRPYDPDRMTAKGVFLKKLTINGVDSYLIAEKMKYKDTLFFYLYYLSKSDIKKALPINTDADYKDIQKAVESPDYKHPKNLNEFALTPKIYVNQKQLNTLTGKEEARRKIKNFMTQAIYAPPIRNKNDKLVFSGGPMYKRALANFSKKGGSTRRTKRKQRKTRKH